MLDKFGKRFCRLRTANAGAAGSYITSYRETSRLRSSGNAVLTINLLDQRLSASVCAAHDATRERVAERQVQ